MDLPQSPADPWTSKSSLLSHAKLQAYSGSDSSLQVLPHVLPAPERPTREKAETKLEQTYKQNTCKMFTERKIFITYTHIIFYSIREVFESNNIMEMSPFIQSYSK